MKGPGRSSRTTTAERPLSSGTHSSSQSTDDAAMAIGWSAARTFSSDRRRTGSSRYGVATSP